MEFENLLKLIEHVSKSGLDSFSYEENGTKIKLKKDKPYVEIPEHPVKRRKVCTENVENAQYVQYAENGAAGYDISGNDTSGNDISGREIPGREISGNEVKSPLVGVFYAAPAEDAPAFVSVGDTVKKGQTLAIVEAMKLMNEIESEYDGVVKKIMVSNGEAVEYGQTLFVIE